jgi:hypothetical protein
MAMIKGASQNPYRFVLNMFMLVIIGLILGRCQRPLHFMSMKKIDSHVHIRYEGAEALEQAAIDNFRLLTILVDHSDIEWQQQFADVQLKIRPECIALITTFEMKGWEDPDWLDRTLNYLTRAFDQGAVAVKVWKNIGMVEKDKQGRFIMIDHPKFRKIFDLIESRGKTLTAHIGEPKDCWLPLDQMKSNSNRNYYSRNPQYHMALHPDFPSYEEQIQSYENVLQRHPTLRYVGCHLGSIEWSVQELAKRLDRYPNMAVDMSARIDDIQLLGRDEVRKFMIDYQDRLLYGTDLGIKEGSDVEAFCNRLHDTWMQDWYYLATDSTQALKGIPNPVQGLDLPPKVLKKIYYTNALKWYPDLKKTQ